MSLLKKFRKTIAVTLAAATALSVGVVVRNNVTEVSAATLTIEMARDGIEATLNAGVTILLQDNNDRFVTDGNFEGLTQVLTGRWFVHVERVEGELRVIPLFRVDEETDAWLKDFALQRQQGWRTGYNYMRTRWVTWFAEHDEVNLVEGMRFQPVNDEGNFSRQFQGSSDRNLNWVVGDAVQGVASNRTLSQLRHPQFANVTDWHAANGNPLGTAGFRCTETNTMIRWAGGDTPRFNTIGAGGRMQGTALSSNDQDRFFIAGPTFSDARIIRAIAEAEATPAPDVEATPTPEPEVEATPTPEPEVEVTPTPEPATPRPTYAPVDFADVRAYADGGWYFNYIRTAQQLGLMRGMGDETPPVFAPAGPFTRAQVMTVLYRMADSPEVTGNNRFADVALDSWFRNYIIWADSVEVLGAFGGGLQIFPNQAMTRLETVVVLNDFAAAMGYVLPAVNEVVTFADASDIPAAALEAVNNLVGADVIRGMTEGENVFFRPDGTLTRAQFATMLSRLVAAIEAGQAEEAA